MKKRFISLVAAAALVGGIAIASTPATSQAGTMTLKGDTTASFYGFIRYEAGWSKDMGSGSASTIYATTPTQGLKTNFESNATITRFGFLMSNKDANLTGRIEADFRGGSGHLRLRRAYVQHNFDNYYILVGQDWGVEEAPTYSAAWYGVAGFAGNARMPQIKLGANLDLGGATVGLALALEDIDYTNVSAGITQEEADEYNAIANITGADPISPSVGIEIARKTVPGIAAKINFGIETGFGAPASVYAFGLATPMKLKITDIDGTVYEKSKTPVIFGTGFELPISMVTVQANYLYGKGANGYANAGNAPDSYNVVNDSLKAAKFYAYNFEGKISPMACVTVAAGYDYVEFKDYADGNPKIKDQSYFANVALNTTKYTQLVLEWDHVKAKYTGEDSQTGNRYWFNYTYYF